MLKNIIMLITLGCIPMNSFTMKDTLDTQSNLLSISEDNGLANIAPTDLNIYSIGISTAGRAEIRMAQQNPNCHVTATTIDEKGAQFTKELVKKHKLEKQITVKLEDVSQPLPYQENSFDFIYARLILHYLSKQKLKHALAELYRALKPGGKLFVVVRSNQNHDAMGTKTTYDPRTCLTTTTYPSGHSSSRFFHDKQSIINFLKSAGYSISHSKEYKELLCRDYERTKIAEHTSHLIEVLAVK